VKPTPTPNPIGEPETRLSFGDWFTYEDFAYRIDGYESTDQFVRGSTTFAPERNEQVFVIISGAVKFLQQQERSQSIPGNQVLGVLADKWYSTWDMIDFPATSIDGSAVSSIERAYGFNRWDQFRTWQKGSFPSGEVFPMRAIIQTPEHIRENVSCIGFNDDTRGTGDDITFGAGLSGSVFPTRWYPESPRDT
jgi:hypothetical protein